MPTWNRVMREIEALNTPDSLDIVRRNKIERVQQITGRALVVYATDFTNSNPAKVQLRGAMSISLTDKDGFDEVTQNLTEDSIDIVEATKLMQSCGAKIGDVMPELQKLQP